MFLEMPWFVLLFVLVEFSFVTFKLTLEIVFTKAAPALFMGCVLNINTMHMSVEK